MILAKPTIDCNLKCKYCYEHSFRGSGDVIRYDPEIVHKVILDSTDKEIILHGGEPLMIGKSAVRDLLALIFNKTGKSGIQTNGVLIDDDYIEIFKEFRTNVGISIDGPGQLNRFRTKPAITERIIDSIETLCQSGISVSVIIVLSKANGLPDKLPELFKFLHYLSERKITGRINPCISGNESIDLDEEQLILAYSMLLKFVSDSGYCWSPFIDMWNALQGSDKVVCTFRGCDIFHTPSCQVLLGDGTITNCMRVSQKDLFYRDPTKHNTRDEVLAQVDQDHFGCQGCEYWYACHGGCPTHAVGDDWRNRTRLCSLYRQMFRTLKGYQKAFNLMSPRGKPETKQVNYGTNHTDGIEHIDNSTRHLDSGKGA